MNLRNNKILRICCHLCLNINISPNLTLIENFYYRLRVPRALVNVIQRPTPYAADAVGVLSIIKRKLVLNVDTLLQRQEAVILDVDDGLLPNDILHMNSFALHPAKSKATPQENSNIRNARRIEITTKANAEVKIANEVNDATTKMISGAHNTSREM
ncbi:10159_t:CDS:2 [Dentiscutata erythropus]|uniref:10159_t:CDS:1 n=1 Tax=Dentiscutata erythropus TaxID=1348616 RepID=A0A9N9GVU1_9GLOM|nr:10159_t:CDS:2 [Dentiscutata erythropus]